MALTERRIGALGAILSVGLVTLIVLVGGGTVLGVGPLAPTPPPSEVTDPDEVLARSLQAVLDSGAVHLEGTLTGTIPGVLVDRPEATIRLDGTVLEGDARPHDGKTRTHLDSPALDLALDSVTVWDGVWYRFAPDAAWKRTSLGDASADAGIDINPLTLVERLRSYLATPGTETSMTTVACGAPSGRCREVRLVAGSDPAMVLGSVLPKAQGDVLAEIDVVITLQADVETLRPVRLIADATTPDDRVDVRLQLDAGHWDEDLVIEEPATDEGG